MFSPAKAGVTIKPLAISVLNNIGFFEVIRRLQRKRLIIVMYHRFSIGCEPFKLNADVFEKQIIFFKKKYNIISFTELIDCFQGESKLPNNPLIITIDDGYYDNYNVAFPILKKYESQATIFLATDFISRKNWLWPNKLEHILKHSYKSEFTFPIDGENVYVSVGTFRDWHRSQLTIFNKLRKLGDTKELILDELARFLRVQIPSQTSTDFRSMDWKNVLEMQDSGISFGSHTCSHPILSSIDKDSIRKELGDSKSEIENHVGKSVDVICYPNGRPEDISSDVVSVAKECGYLAGVTTIAASNCPDTTNKYRLNRCTFNTCDPNMIIKEIVRLPRN